MIMKYQQVSVDLVNMMMTACSYLALAGAAWVLLRLLQACFWLPRHFKKQNNVQKLLQDKIDTYEKYLAECEARDKLEGIDYNSEGMEADDMMLLDGSGNPNKWREQRDSLEMLKRELDRVRDGVNVTDWDYLLEESQEEAVNTGNEEERKGKQSLDTPEVNSEKEKEEEEEEASCAADEKKDK